MTLMPLLMTSRTICDILEMEADMAVRIKPVQSTEIKDKRIALKIIKQIRKPISPEAIERNRKMDEFVDKFMR
jgi:hypothetical protein